MCILAPNEMSPSSFVCGTVAGTITEQGTFNSLAFQANPCPKLPALEVHTAVGPSASWRALSVFPEPLCLNEPVGCRLSSLRYIWNRKMCVNGLFLYSTHVTKSSHTDVDVDEFAIFSVTNFILFYCTLFYLKGLTICLSSLFFAPQKLILFNMTKAVVLQYLSVLVFSIESMEWYEWCPDTVSIQSLSCSLQVI